VSAVVHAPGCTAPLVVNGVRRPGCNGTYVCLGCERECGWCFGCGDDMPELCDDCWFDVTKAREAAKAGRDGGANG
jgi:hypothetical protein